MELDYPSIQIAPDLTLAPLEGMFQATRTSEGIYISGTLHSSLVVQCVRCLEDARQPITIQIDELFYYPPWSAPEGEQVVGEDAFIDLAPIVRDLSLLDVPMRPTCRPDCRGFCDQCGQNLNEGDCGCEKNAIDPRLEELRRLLDS
jgi:uncharacterized protein